MKLFTRFILGAAMLGASVAGAQQPGSAALVIKPTNRTVVEARARGERRDTLARTGDVIRYTLTFTNTVGKAVRGLELKDPIPAGLQFVDGSAESSRADATLEFSADGGKTWSAQPTEPVTVDGKTEERPVPAERYTHVRWMVAGWVQPRATVTAHFDARVGTLASASSRGQSAASSKPTGR